MKCPTCGGDTMVRDSRQRRAVVYRRRQCSDNACGQPRFSTKEILFDETRCRSVLDVNVSVEATVGNDGFIALRLMRPAGAAGLSPEPYPEQEEP